MVETGSEYTTRSQRLWQEAQVALAEARGWPHGSHREPYKVVERLRHETRIRRLGQMFSMPSALHQNFYEEWPPLEHVAERAANIQEFRDALSGLMDHSSGQS